VTAAISVQVSKFCFHSAIPGIKLSHHVYLFTATGLTPGGSSTVHIYTKKIHRTTQWNRLP